MSTILVIIVTYNAMRWAERCLDSLRKSSVVPDIYIIDNGSTDGTQNYIKEHYPKALFYQSNKNLGFGKANNIGLQYALDHHYSYIYLLNQDAWIMPDTFERLIDLSKEYPDYGILSPFQMNEAKQHIDRDFLFQTMSWKSNPDIVNDLYNQKIEDVYPVSEVMAAHWFLTYECIQKTGGFSPSFFQYGEDGNYTDRVRYRKLKIGIVPSLRVVHDRDWRETSNKQQMYQAYTSYIRMLSNPLELFWKSHLRMAYYIIKHIMMFKSFRPFCYFMKIVLEYRIIVKNRGVSMNKECAFLD